MTVWLIELFSMDCRLKLLRLNSQTFLTKSASKMKTGLVTLSSADIERRCLQKTFKNNLQDDDNRLQWRESIIDPGIMEQVEISLLSDD